MLEAILDAGLSEIRPKDSTNGFKPTNARRAAIMEIRSKLRKPNASDDDWDDAIDALVEIARDPTIDG